MTNTDPIPPTRDEEAKQLGLAIVNLQAALEAYKRSGNPRPFTEFVGIVLKTTEVEK